MLKVIASFLISIFYINILSGQFYSVDVNIDDRLLRSDEKHEIVNLKNDIQNFFLNTVWNDNYSDLDINLYVQIVFEGVTQKGNESIYNCQALFSNGADLRYFDKSVQFFYNSGSSLYFSDGSWAKAVFSMSIYDTELPSAPLIDRNFYSLGYNDGYIYASDAVDYVQQGWSYRYTNSGSVVDSVQVGIIPGGYCFNN